MVGGTGQAKVLRSILDSDNCKILGVFDDTDNLPSPYEDVKILGKTSDIINYSLKVHDTLFFTIAIGNPNGMFRVSFSEILKQNKLQPISLISETAFIDKGVMLAEGVQVLPSSTIMACTQIGKQCIVNTNSNIDHECIIGQGCEVGPGANLCGNVEMLENSWVGAGATILPRVKIGKNSIIGAGSVVVKSVPDNSVMVGNPARKLRTL